MTISGTINGTTESAAYTYDNLGRLVTSNQTSNGSSAQRRFAYDRWGNRTGVWDATSGGNQIQSLTPQQSGGVPTNQIASVTSGSTVNYVYDAAGNVINDGVHSYTYDSENRLSSVDGGSTASYAYDNQNRRYKKTVGSTLTHYVWEGSKVLAEHNGSTGAVLIDYVYAGSRMIAKIASGTTQYFLSDQLSTRLVLNTSGTVLGRQAHLPFGEDFGESGSQEKHHFTTYERDGESGTDYAVNRQYAQTTARFNRVDPYGGSYTIGNPQSANRFAYAGNDPINRLDPLGLWWFCLPSRETAGETVNDCFWIDSNPDPGVGRRGGIEGGGSQRRECDKAKDQLGKVTAAATLLYSRFFKNAKKLAEKYGVKSEYDKFLSEYNGARSAALSGSSPVDLQRFQAYGKQLGDLLIGGHIQEPDAFHLEGDGQKIKNINVEVQEAADKALTICNGVPNISQMELDFLKSLSDFLAREGEITDKFLVGVFSSLDTVR